MRTTLIALAVALVVAGPLPGGASMVPPANVKDPIPEPGIVLPGGIVGESGSARTPRTPIAIRGDSAICAPASGVGNCGTADGSQANPYVISGWDIDSTTVPALAIRETTKWIVVRSNTLRSPTDSTVPAVRLTSVTNLVLELNTVSSGRATSIVLSDATAPVTLSENQVTARGPDGGTHDLVTVTSSPHVTISANQFKAADGVPGAVGTLLRVSDSAGAALADNWYSQSSGTGILIEAARGVSATGETFRTVKTGIVLAQSPDVTLSGLDMDEALDGVRVLSSTNLAISSSSIMDNWPCSPSCESTGVHATDSTVTITATNITDFTEGVTLVSSGNESSSLGAQTPEAPAHLRARGIALTGNGVGIHAVGAARVQVHDSDIHGNGVGIVNDASRFVAASHVWWGCATGPGNAGCDTVQGQVDWVPPATAPFRS